MAKVQIDGVPETIAKLEQLVAGAGGANLAKAVLGGGYMVEGFAKIKCPVDTGNLRSSIHTELTEQRDDYAAAEVSPSANYGGYVELGTSRSRKQPYLRPAADENENRVIAAMVTVLTQGIAK